MTERLRPGPDVPARYAVDYSRGHTVTLDAEGTLDAVLAVRALEANTRTDARLRGQLRHVLKDNLVQRVRLLGPKEGMPPEVIQPSDDLEDAVPIDAAERKRQRKAKAKQAKEESK